MFGSKTKACQGCGKQFDKRELTTKDRKELCKDCYVSASVAELDFSPANKRRILIDLIEAGGKYKKPFTKGELATFSVFGGSWNEYAQIVMSMIMVDTLVAIEEKLNALAQR